MITVSPEKKIGEYSMSIIDAIFFFFNKQERRVEWLPFIFAGKHGGEGEIEVEKDFL